MVIKRNVIVEVRPTEEELIKQISEMDNVDQFYFLAHLDDVFFESNHAGIMQLQYISDLMEREDVEEEIKKKVRHFVCKLHEYLGR